MFNLHVNTWSKDQCVCDSKLLNLCDVSLFGPTSTFNVMYLFLAQLLRKQMAQIFFFAKSNKLFVVSNLLYFLANRYAIFCAQRNNNSTDWLATQYPHSVFCWKTSFLLCVMNCLRFHCGTTGTQNLVKQPLEALVMEMFLGLLGKNVTWWCWFVVGWLVWCYLFEGTIFLPKDWPSISLGCWVSCNILDFLSCIPKRGLKWGWKGKCRWGSK